MLHVLTNLAYGGAQSGTVNVCIGVLHRGGFDVRAAYSSRGCLCQGTHFRCKSLERRVPIFLLVAEPQGQKTH